MLTTEPVVYVIERGWHTDIGIPVNEIIDPLATLERPFSGVRYLTFGFGERQFLVDHSKTTGAMLKALLPSRSALLMTALRDTPQAAFGQQHVITLHISRDGLDQMQARIWRSFEQSPADQPVKLADGPYPGSTFFAAGETYDGLYTCNTWAAEILHAGGLPMPTAGVLFVGQVMGMARWISRSQASMIGR